MRPGDFYSRYANPTVRAFEEAVAELEGAEDALAFGSGMGAIASTVLALCSAGDHIVIQRQIYAGTIAFVQGPCARLGIEHTVVDGTQPGAFADAVRPGRTMLVIAESPSNPRLDLDRPRRARRDQRPVHGHRLDVRHADRPAAAAPRRRPRPALGDQGDLRAQRRHARRDRRRAASCSTRSGPTPCSTAPAPRRSTPSTGCAASARSPCASATRPTSPCACAEALPRPPRRRRRAPPRPARPPPARAGRAPADVPADGAWPSTSPAASTPPGRCSTPCAWPDRRRRSAVPRRWCATRRPARTSACRPRSRRRSASPPGLVRVSIGLEDGDDMIADLERAIPT